MTKNANPKGLFSLSDRALINITGADAEGFLQSLITNDIRQVSRQKMVYACLLTPQGQFLYDFFVLSDDAGGYLLDCAQELVESLIKHLNMFRLRAKVDIQNVTGRYHIYSSAETMSGHFSLIDPRHPKLGWRFYAESKTSDVEDVSGYHNFCIGQGVVSRVSSLRIGKDFPQDLNLDALGAINWDKGCFTGQEVVARIRYRGLVKRRLFIIEGRDLQAGVAVFQDGVEVGEIRQVNDSQEQGLAVIKLEAAAGQSSKILITQDKQIRAITPHYLTN